MKKLGAWSVCACLALVAVGTATAATPRPKKAAIQSCATVLTPAQLQSVTGLATTIERVEPRSTFASDCEYLTDVNDPSSKVLDFVLYPSASSFYDLKWKMALQNVSSIAARDPSCAATPAWGPSECAPTVIPGLGTRAFTSTIDTLVQKGPKLMFFETWWKDTSHFEAGLRISPEQMQTLMRAMLPRLR